jgi:CheY-like chemotaxis protein
MTPRSLTAPPFFTKLYKLFTRLPARSTDRLRSLSVRGDQSCERESEAYGMVHHGTIFYVDDNPKSRRLLTSVIRSCGFEVMSAGDPIEALSRIKKSSFDLALLDYQMPHLAVSQLAQHIKRVKPDVPVVLLSGFSALPPFELIFADAHVGRGATLDELLDTMRSLIHSKYAFAKLRSAARTRASGSTCASLELGRAI